jgi:type I restriction enzyme S subunit
MSWKKIKLGEIMKVRENRFKPNDKAIADLKRIDKIDFSGEIFISDKPSNTDMILVKKGDLVISGINVEKGAMAVYTGEDDITATIHYSSYSFDEKTTDIEFLKSFLKSIKFKNALKEQVPGGIKTEIKPKHLIPLIVEIPTDIRDQQEVVKLLQSKNSKVDAISSEITNQLNLAKKLRQQLLQDAVQGKLVEQNKKDEPASELLKKIKAEKEKLIAEKKIKQGKIQEAEKQDELLFEIPKNWTWCSLDEISKNITDGTHQTPIYTKEGRIFLSAQNIKPFKFMPEDHKFVTEEAYQDIIRNRKPEKGDILIARVGAGIGEAAVINQDIDFCFYVSLGLVQPFKDFLNTEYLTLVINSPYGVNYAKGNISSKGGSAGNFNLGRIRSFLIPLPPLAEQNRIVQKVDELMLYCYDLEASIKQSESQNEKLLQQVLQEALRQPTTKVGKKEEGV